MNKKMWTRRVQMNLVLLAVKGAELENGNGRRRKEESANRMRGEMTDTNGIITDYELLTHSMHFLHDFTHLR